MALLAGTNGLPNIEKYTLIKDLVLYKVASAIFILGYLIVTSQSLSAYTCSSFFNPKNLNLIGVTEFYKSSGYYPGPIATKYLEAFQNQIPLDLKKMKKVGQGNSAKVYLEVSRNLVYKIPHGPEKMPSLEIEEKIFNLLKFSFTKYHLKVPRFLEVHLNGRYLVREAFTADQLAENIHSLSPLQTAELQKVFSGAQDFAKETGIGLDLKAMNLAWDGRHWVIFDLAPRMSYLPFGFTLDVPNFNRYVEIWREFDPPYIGNNLSLSEMQKMLNVSSTEIDSGFAEKPLPTKSEYRFNYGLDTYKVVVESALRYEGIVFWGTPLDFSSFTDAEAKARTLLENGAHPNGNDTDLFKYIRKDVESDRDTTSFIFISASKRINIAKNFALFDASSYGLIVVVDASKGNNLDVNRFLDLKGFDSPHRHEDEVTFINELPAEAIQGIGIVDKKTGFVKAISRPEFEQAIEAFFSAVDLKSDSAVYPSTGSKSTLQAASPGIILEKSINSKEAFSKLGILSNQLRVAKNSYIAETLIDHVDSILSTIDLTRLNPSELQELSSLVSKVADSLKTAGDNYRWYEWAHTIYVRKWLARLGI